MHIIYINSNCRKGNIEATTRPGFEKHINDDNSIKKFKCTKCPFEEGSRDKINEHMAIIHTTDEQFRCRRCDYKADTSDILSHHMADVHDIDVRQNKNASQVHFSEKRANQRHNQNRSMQGKKAQ